jgi:hypothetical protein
MLSAWLVWDLVGALAPRLTLFLLCVILANSESLLMAGNGSGLAKSLCIAAVWCFIKQRHELIGVLCFALGVALKPQEVGLIGFFFLLAGGYRRRGWQVSGVAVVLLVLSLLWIAPASPHWIQEWRTNVSSSMSHGDVNDPGPASEANDAVGMIVSLQSVISFFRDDPRIYNPATYLLVGIPILIWCVVTVRARPSDTGRWLAIASMAALSLLPVYHRQYDAKLLLLTVPACAVLWSQRNLVGKLAAATTCAGIILTSDMPVASLILIGRSLHLSQHRLGGQLVALSLARTPALALILVGSFYLWAYVRHEWRARAAVPHHAEQDLQMAPLSV